MQDRACAISSSFEWAVASVHIDRAEIKSCLTLVIKCVCEEELPSSGEKKVKR
jgi:hypothetical protein